MLKPVKALPDAIDLQVIYVKEEKPPRGKEPIEWLWKLRFLDDQRTGGYTGRSV
ncbi:hypothetical protein Holit_01412 [Hollandina sp. SP2]